MARGLKTLIKINEWNVEQKQRKLGDILRLIDSLETQARLLEEELVREQAAAAASPEEAGFIYGNYADAVIHRRERLEQSIVQAEVEADAAREELGEAYRDLKKFETAQANREAMVAKELARKEQITLDEVGLQGYLQRR